MKPPAILLMVILGPLGLLADTVSDLLPPQKRAETVALARTLLTIKPTDLTEEELAARNPFNPNPPVVSAGRVEASTPQLAVAVALSDRELLKNMADSINPSGVIQLGGRAILLVGKKKLTVGDRLSVNTDGIAYELEVSAIDLTSFTLRFKSEEMTRLIKSPVKKP